MPGRIEKTVFISYRRTNLPWALAIFQNLKNEGYDVFFDYLSIPSGDFENIIVENIKARAHFVVILTPSALERCNEPGDWLRREIETAMDEKRNIVPLMLESFDFGSPSTVSALTGKLEKLKKYNGLRLHSEYFFEGMDRLRKQYLNVSLDTIIHPVSEETKPVIAEHQVAANEAPPVEKEELTAQEWFERGYTFGETQNYDEAIRCFTEAIRLSSDFWRAFAARAVMHERKQDLDRAIDDLMEAIHLKPDEHLLFGARGYLYQLKSNYSGAIEDYTEYLRLKPDDAKTYYNRGYVYYKNGKFDEATADFDVAILLQPDSPNSFIARGVLRRDKGDLDGAITDFDNAIHLDQNHAQTYLSRARTWEKKRDYPFAIADYQKYLELDGNIKEIDQKNLEKKIRDLKTKLTKKKKTRQKKGQR